VEGKGWTDAEDLRTGDQVQQADGTTGLIWLKWNVHKTQEMYNLTIDTAHTFFVGEGQWLVHNACGYSDEWFEGLGDMPPESAKAFQEAVDKVDSGDVYVVGGYAKGYHQHGGKTLMYS